MRLRRSLNRIHIWLGWLVAIPLLLWTVSGLFMVAFPIEQVRGTHLRKETPPLATGALVPPRPGPGPVETITAEQQAAGARWVIGYAGGRFARADARTGEMVAPVDRAEAIRIAQAARRGEGRIESVTLFAAKDNPLDLRRERPAWQVHFAEGANFYIDQESGRLIAVRTPLWRAYDVMWGLHIMDPTGREDSHHPLLYGLAGIATLMVLLGLLLLPLTIRRRRKRRQTETPTLH